MPKSLPFQVNAPYREMGIYYAKITGAATPTLDIDPASCLTLSDDGVGVYGLTLDDPPHALLAAWVNMRDPDDIEDACWVDAVNTTTGKITIKTYDESAGALADFGKDIDVFFVIGRSS